MAMSVSSAGIFPQGRRIKIHHESNDLRGDAAQFQDGGTANLANPANLWSRIKRVDFVLGPPLI
jgi:hypothetical protein